MKNLNPISGLSLFLMTVLLFSSSCAQTQQKSDSKTAINISKVLSVVDFEKGIKSGGDIQLIDVRTPEEVAAGAIEDAVNYDFYAADFAEKIKTLSPDKVTYIYCRSGGRSGKTAKILEQSGFREVYDLEGGFIAWKAAH